MKYTLGQNVYPILTSFDVPLTLYLNKETKKYLKKVLKMKVIGIDIDHEETAVGNIKIDIGRMAEEGQCELISRSTS